MLITVPAAAHGQRLDVFVSSFFPQFGMRAVRRLWAQMKITINGRPQKPGYCLHTGDLLDVLTPNASRLPDDVSAALLPDRLTTPPLPATLFWHDRHLALVCKPAGLHSVYNAHTLNPSLEQQLPDLLRCSQLITPPGFPQLLNRLDYGTSGLLAVALNPAGADWWHEAENGRQIKKRYLTLALPHALPDPIPENWCIRNRINTVQRRRSRVEPENNVDPARHTSVHFLGTLALTAGIYSRLASAQRCTPAGSMPDPCPCEVSLLGCTILQGARHQIRAHLAHAGFPLLGDTLYAGSPSSNPLDDQFFLHCAAMQIQNVWHVCLPDWLDILPRSLVQCVQNWLVQDTFSQEKI